MNSVFSIALSGLDAAMRRFSGAASNVANLTTTGKLPEKVGEKTNAYQPVDVVTLSQEASGGVTSEMRARDPAYRPAYAPSSPDANEKGLVATPNVSIESEMVTMMTAKIAYEANAKVIKAAADTQDKLLDALS